MANSYPMNARVTTAVLSSAYEAVFEQLEPFIIPDSSDVSGMI